MSHSALSIGIVGLPNVGKSTLFKALTKKEVLIANYPFATIDPSVGVVEVPDERLDKLSNFSHSQKKIPAIIEFVDIAGLVRGANKGEGLGNQFLANIREVDAVVYVVRAFEDESIHHVEARIDPKDDLEILKTELMLKDLETVNKHLEKVARLARGNDKEAIAELPILEKLKAYLEDGKMADKVFLEVYSEGGEFVIEKLKRELQLLTSKRGILLVNVNDKPTLPSFGKPTKDKPPINDVQPTELPIIEMNIREELEGAGFSDEERKELGLSSSKLSELIKVAHKTLGLISFFTTGEKETRAWTVEKSVLAPQAAGVIHTDFEEKFIRAEIIKWNELIEESSGWGDAKSKGLIQTVGKDYEVQDGDVLEVKHGA